MKRTKVLSLLSVCAVAGMLLVPVQSYAGIQDDINQLNQKQKEMEEKRKDTETKKANLNSQMEQVKTDISSLQKNIEEEGRKKDELNLKLGEAKLKQQETEGRLKEAENRMAAREKLLKSRVRLMYMNGSVSYLDVLFSSTSFSDFLDRFESISTIVGKDKELFEANKQDRDIIAKEKKLKDEQLAMIRSLTAEQEAVVQTLVKKEKDKEVKIASLSKDIKIADEMSEDQDQAILQILDQKRALRKKLDEQNRQANGGKVGVSSAVKAYSGGKLAWPVPSSSTITSTFGYRVDPIKNIRKLHKGIDIGAPKGTTIVAAESGSVILASWVNGYGNTVVIDHGNGLSTWYGHIMEGGIKVNDGDTVKRGQKIAEVGSTGDSTGFHLHFEVRNNDEATDPTSYLR